MRRVFYTVTNSRYWAGTVATLSSIRRFYPDDPVWVIPESRHALTSEQQAHLRCLPIIHVVESAKLGVGVVHEAWQSKAHAAAFLSRHYAGTSDVLIHLDSDLVLAHDLDAVVDRVVETGRPAGGKDGRGVTYEPAEYAPYLSLCGPERSHCDPVRNSNHLKEYQRLTVGDSRFIRNDLAHGRGADRRTLSAKPCTSCL
jgi:hypothetical protein